MKTNKVQISSSHGQVWVDLKGWPLKRFVYDRKDPEAWFLLRVHRFDVDEWRQRYPKYRFEDQGELDILDIGYWLYEKGKLVYEGPAEDWREERWIGEKATVTSGP